jgi:hypothetical protein
MKYLKLKIDKQEMKMINEIKKEKEKQRKLKYKKYTKININNEEMSIINKKE